MILTFRPSIAGYPSARRQEAQGHHRPRIQTVFYEDVGQVKLGDYFTLDVARRELRGDFRTGSRLYFWNSWLAK